MSTESYRGERAFFLGNGIHRTENNHGISWGHLLQRISESYWINVDLDNDLKPFPLAFEEMLYAKEGRNNIYSKLQNLKTAIAEILFADEYRIVDSAVHLGFMQSGVKEIITTNYDYNLEASVEPNFVPNKKAFSINNFESKHSLYRGYKVNNVTVRHIHGELKHNRKISIAQKSYPEESIMIGFEHYSDYFAKIQQVIKGLSGKQRELEKKSLLLRLRDNDKEKIWTDLLFTHEIIFAGFSLDFSENHLWWLLLQREELKRKTNKFDVRINNDIIFCVPAMPENEINYNVISKIGFEKLHRRQMSFQKNRAVTDVLKSMGIEIQSIPCDSYHSFYMKVIERYRIN